jgi:hypothetical protein
MPLLVPFLLLLIYFLICYCLVSLPLPLLLFILSEDAGRRYEDTYSTSGNALTLGFAGMRGNWDVQYIPPRDKHTKCNI